MKITAGKHKNRLLAVPKYKPQSGETRIPELRPSMSKTRQAVFNTLQHASFLPRDMIEGANVLDICCGCGVFGLEALSRGATSVVFIDISPINLETARRNAAHLNEQGNTLFWQLDATKLPTSSNKYNVIYIDPPYNKASAIVPAILAGLQEGKWLAPEHIVVVETGSRARLTLPEGYQLLEERKYGGTKMSFLVAEV